MLKSDCVPCFLLAALAGLALPLILIPVVHFTHHPVIIEEVAKLIVVFFIISKLPTMRLRILAGLLFGFLYGISETIFFVAPFDYRLAMQIFSERLLSTIPMHIATVLVMVVLGLWRKHAILIGFLLAILIHLVFDSYIVALLMRV